MLKIISIGILASTATFLSAQAAQACGGRCGAAQPCATTACPTAGCGMATPGTDDGSHVMPATPPAPPAPQASANVRRSLSYEPAAPAMIYRSPSRSTVPHHTLQKTDPRRYSGGY